LAKKQISDLDEGMLLAALSDTEKAEEIRTVIAEVLRLRDCATRAEADMLAFLLENVLHEARAELAARGYPPELNGPSPEGNVLKLR
jgi:hypothetical protein